MQPKESPQWGIPLAEPAALVGSMLGQSVPEGPQPAENTTGAFCEGLLPVGRTHTQEQGKV